MTRKIFSLEEARQTVEIVRPWLKEILEIRQVVLARRPELIPVLQKIGQNGGNKAAGELLSEFKRMEELMKLIQETGALVKDLNMGLLDFPALREGREVYLCWNFGEDTIRFWHEISGGMAGRQPVEE